LLHAYPLTREFVFAEPFTSSGRLYSLINNLLPRSECYFFVCFEVATQ
jgi:hypothetical protein